MISGLAGLRHANIQRFVRSLLRHSRLSRADLARQADVSAVTASKVVDHLIEHEILVEIAESANASVDRSVGRPPRMVALHPTRCVLTLEVEPSSTQASLVSFSGDCLETASIPTPSLRTIEDWVAAIRPLVEPAVAKGACAVSVGIPGIFSRSDGLVQIATKAKWLEGNSVVAALKSITKLPITVTAEAKASALGYGAFSENQPGGFLIVNLSEGIGGAILDQSASEGGTMSMYGEVGQIPVVIRDPKTGDNIQTALEVVAGLDGLAQRYQLHIKSPSATTAEMLQHIAAHGVEDWLRPPLELIGTVLAGAVNLVGIEHVVLVGPLARVHPEILATIAAKTRQYALTDRICPIQVIAIENPRQKGLLVAALDLSILPRLLERA